MYLGIRTRFDLYCYRYRQYTFEQGKKSHLIYFIPFYFMILTVSSFAFCNVKNDLLTIRAVLCRKRAYMPVCTVLVELAIICVHDYIVVTIKVTKIYGKNEFQ